MEESPGVRENCYSEIRSDSQRQEIRFHLSDNIFGGGLGRLASPHSPQTPSSPAEKRHEEMKESGRARGGKLSRDFQTEDPFGPRDVALFGSELALERKRNEAISERDSRSAFWNDGVYFSEHTTQALFPMPYSRSYAMGASEASHSVTIGGEGIQNVQTFKLQTFTLCVWRGCERHFFRSRVTFAFGWA